MVDADGKLLSVGMPADSVDEKNFFNLQKTALERFFWAGGQSSLDWPEVCRMGRISLDQVPPHPQPIPPQAKYPTF